MLDHHIQGEAETEAEGLGRSAPDAAEPHEHRGVLATVWNALTALVGGIMGMLPHLLHHLGLLGGAVLMTGAMTTRGSDGRPGAGMSIGSPVTSSTSER